MRVVTLNVQNDEGDPRRVGLLNRVLREVAADVVVLQEVCYPGRRDHLAELLAGTGLVHTTHQADVLGRPPAGTERFGGGAVATRWAHSVVDVREHRPRTATERHWWVLAVAVTVPVLGDLLLVSPTTPWEPDVEDVRERVAGEVLDVDDRHRRALPTVVAGDLNAGPGSASLRVLAGRFRDAWAVAGDGPGYTWSVDNPLAAAEIGRLLGEPGHRRRIDHVLVGPGARVGAARLVADRPVDGVWLSDHAGVLVDLDPAPG
ncbi:endonuclease/exonuclease/phosphatase family protein [Pseudonocardia humida]|uniref:Endonuclease/exonuclease/phosphatase family protein n=1 Tax=Pseudonocardia humida TaxID=2800819 RepID=A0ABT1AAZ0_9PSEU|nr:endonuclease/exonuclease/phosphatase family protein [Pseudonocardia humida]MCO1660207.1 endonuclease/exonuclease/phosphatase family protein [Pseudonocardia humida]